MRIILAPVAVAAAALLCACAARNSYVDLYGQSAPSTAAERTIVLRPDTRYVNVEGGQVVRFLVDGKEFTWHFMVARTVDAFPLNDVAPPGVLDHRVMAYVSPDPRYMGGADIQ